MQVVILSGGLGTRLRSVAHDIPKAMVPVAGKPFVDHQTELFKSQRLNNLHFCIGYLGEQIESHLRDGGDFGLSVSYSREAPGNLLGTGGALVNAISSLEEEFLVVYGDSYLPTDFGAFINWSRASGFPAVMSVFRNTGQWDASNVLVEADRVSRYSKKALPGECDFIDYGLSYFRREIFSPYVRGPFPLDLAVIQERLVSQGALGAFEVQERFYEVGKPEGVEELDKYLSAGRH